MRSYTGSTDRHRQPGGQKVLRRVHVPVMDHSALTRPRTDVERRSFARILPQAPHSYELGNQRSTTTSSRPYQAGISEVSDERQLNDSPKRGGRWQAEQHGRS